MTARDTPHLDIYQFHVLLLDISPAIWRRLVLRSDSTIADLHHILQIIMGWSDTHLTRFHIRGVDYGVAKPGGFWFRDDPATITLRDLHLRINERILYTYDFGDNWQHQVRLEKFFPYAARNVYPRCTGGARIVPPEDCGGAWAFLEHEGPLTDALWQAKVRLIAIMHEIIAVRDDPDLRAHIETRRAELTRVLQEVEAGRFNLQTINRQLARTFAAAVTAPDTTY